MKVPTRALVVGAPAKQLRLLSDDDVLRKREGTEVYHDLSRRCLATMHEVPPLTQAPADRASLPASDLRFLTGKR